MLKKLILALVALVLLFVLVGFLLGSDFKVSRKVTIQADVAKVHELVGELRNWPKWAPWQEDDPTIVTTFGPTTTGVGASQTWTGKDGNGELTFTKCDPATGIVFDMVFINGDTRVPSKCWMSYAPASGGVDVEWGIEGDFAPMPVIGGYFGTFADSMMGPMFDKGLTKLKAECEAK
ncbi:MAG: SRPBCC family protein [Planctomycetota bacterium]|nr:SRPBCC family protein [Planctomycetota bacterium]